MPNARTNVANRTRIARAILLAVGITLPVTTVFAQGSASDTTGDWPQFLGPRRNGLSAETGLLGRWPDSGPKIVWRKAGGVGMSGLAVSRGRMFTLVQREGKQWLISLDAQSGEPIWQTAIANEYRNSMGNGPRATPTIDGDQVFAFTGDGTIAAVDFSNGKLLWSHNPITELSGRVAEYGMASSPLVVDGLVIVTAGAPKATLIAYEAKSGEQRWTAGNDPAGYSSPALLTVGGRRQIVAFTGNSALGVAPDTGSVLWRYPYETNFECNIVTPIEFNGQVFLSSGENHGCVMLAIKPTPKKSAGEDQFAVSVVWESQGPKSVLRNEWQTSMLLDGYLYGMDNVGGAGPITHLTCVNAATGERMWQVARFGKGNLIAADGKLIISTMKGELVVARATPDRYDELGRATILGSTRQAPSLAHGLLYLRDDQEIVCVDVRP